MMADPIAVSIISAVFSLLAIVLNAFMGLWIHQLERNTNSIKDDLVRLTGDAEHAKGIIKGRADAVAEHAAVAEAVAKLTEHAAVADAIAELAAHKAVAINDQRKAAEAGPLP